ncbi:MAG TPA: hypothetical protein DIT97_20130 [Gimesia maris]|uniref:Uncharacterized protein n=1 Tax=Gimesia maris TaxID=122 RepID=A0A3D3R9F2_9PLAN|nr:hypothetical protein [Gimesia maris]
MFRSTDAIGAEIGFSDFRMDLKDQFNGVLEIDFEVKITGFAVFMFFNVIQSVTDGSRNTTGRAEDVPVQLQNSLCAGMQTGFRKLLSLAVDCISQGKRPDTGNFLCCSSIDEFFQRTGTGMVCTSFLDLVDTFAQT